MNFPNDLMYTKSHEWIKMQEDGTALVGLSDYAQDAPVSYTHLDVYKRQM